MIFRMVVCRCSQLILEEKEKENIICSKIRFDKCECNREQEVFIWTCKDHPFIRDLHNTQKKGFCAESSYSEVCTVCVEKRYNLNYRSAKFCLWNLPDYIERDAFSMKYYFY